MMNGYEKQDLDDDSFGAKGGIVQAFDAFRTYLHPRPTALAPTDSHDALQPRRNHNTSRGQRGAASGQSP